MNLIWGQVNWAGVPADEKTVRSTAEPYYQDKPAAMQDDQPQMQEYESDSDPRLGLATRQLASKWHEGQRGIPVSLDEVEGVTESATIINRQVSSAGTAARREAAGVVKPTMSYAVGIEPVADLAGGAFGNTYFVRDERVIQGTADNTMMLPSPDHQNTGDLSIAGARDARRAAMAGMYSAFWNGGRA